MATVCGVVLGKDNFICPEMKAHIKICILFRKVAEFKEGQTNIIPNKFGHNFHYSLLIIHLK